MIFVLNLIILEVNYDKIPPRSPWLGLLWMNLSCRGHNSSQWGQYAHKHVLVLSDTLDDNMVLD